MNKKLLIIFFLLLVGIFLRFYNLRYNTQFNWDQENSLAYPAKKILIDHRFPLTGPRTGIGDLYIGPLYSYLSAFSFALLGMDPLAGALLAGVISIVTIILGLLFIKNIFNSLTAAYFMVIWTVSSYVVTLDRIPWNVNLFPLASLMVFFGLWSVYKKKTIIGWLFAGLGVFLGVNSHFTVVFLLSIILGFVFLNRKLVNKSFAIVILLLILALIPLFLFDIRHGYVISKNLLKFSGNSVISLGFFPAKLTKTISITLETIGRLIFFDGARWIQQAAGLLLLIVLFSLRNDRQIRLFFKLFIIYLLIYVLGFTLYSGQTPDYYYIGLLPIAGIGFSLVFLKMQEKFNRFFYLTLTLFLVVLFRSLLIVNQIDAQSLGFKQQTIKKIKDTTMEKPVALVFDMELGHSDGYNYLADYYGIERVEMSKNTDNIYWVSYPANRFPGKPDYIFGEVALGLPKTSKNIYNTKELELYNHSLKLRIPTGWEVLQCPSFDFDKYLLTPNISASCNTYDQEKTGLKIFNLPNCNIWEIENKTELKIGSGLPLYLLSTDLLDKISFQWTRSPIIVTALERNRCIGFVDLENIFKNTYSPILYDILNTLRKST